MIVGVGWAASFAVMALALGMGVPILTREAAARNRRAISSGLLIASRMDERGGFDTACRSGRRAIEWFTHGSRWADRGAQVAYEHWLVQ